MAASLRLPLLAPALTLGAGCRGCEPTPQVDDQPASTSMASGSSVGQGPPAGSTQGPVADGASLGSSSAGTGVANSSTGPGTSTGGSGSTGTTGAAACAKHVVLMGYWPPTNEMLRPWSTDPEQNPGGWIGNNWGGHGYDVYSFFPEFPPDGDPRNDPLGSDGAVGSPRFDLRVDYQATSADFWRLVDLHKPVILVTTSRGGEIGWEIEAIEGGHGIGNPGGPALDWSSDQHGAEQFPTEATIEARSWDAITTYRQGNTLSTQLPVEAIADAASALGLTSVAIDRTGTSGDFLSGFLGLHGLVYHQLAPHNVAAGHIHVGFGLPTDEANQLVEATLHAVLEQHPAERVECPAR